MQAWWVSWFVEALMLPSVHCDLLRKLGRFDDTWAEFERAASRARNSHDHELPLERGA